MSSAPNLRLTVLVPREQTSAHSSRKSTDGNHQPQSATTTSRNFLLVIKNPENVSLGDLANRIKDQWQELWPTERPLQIKQLVNGAYPDTAFTARCSVADIWVDSGRREREGFDQHGIVHVIPVPSSSTSTPTLRRQRAASVFQDVEGAAREANRKRDSGISANDSLTRPGATTPPQNKEHIDPQHHPSKRSRLTDLGSPPPSPAEQVQTTSSSPVFYNGRVPSFALPPGHRRHVTNTSSGSPELGLGLGITASPSRDNMAKATADGNQNPNSMPPPPPRYTLRRSSNSSRLSATKPKERPCNSVPQENSINDFNRPRTRAAQNASGSGIRSHHGTPSSAPKTVTKPGLTTEEYLEKNLNEIREVEKLLNDPKTNPECLTVLQEISDLHKEIITLKAGPGGKERQRLIGMARKRLSRRRNRLEKFKNNGQFHGVSNVRTSMSEEGDARVGPREGPDDSSDEDLPKKMPKRPRIEKRNLLVDFASTCRVSSLRAESGSRPQNVVDKEANGHEIQAVIGNNGTQQDFPSANASSAQSTAAVPVDAATEEHENENRIGEIMTDSSDGEDIEFDAEVFVVQESPHIRYYAASQGDWAQKARTLDAYHGKRKNGEIGVYSIAKEVDPNDVAQLIAPIKQGPEQQHLPPRRIGLLSHLIQSRQEDISKVPPSGSKGQNTDESSASSDDDTSEDDRKEFDGDYKDWGDYI
ncbi:hypothetical protein F1880_001377 [Penicillium rolfsii]|nr:hypothetical protein F1880_001377 [Penicillium rolfsii]